MRWCYLLADYICDDLNIKRVLGKHVPSNADLGTVTDQMREMRLQSGKVQINITTFIRDRKQQNRVQIRNETNYFFFH